MKLATGTSEALSIMRAFAMVSIVLCHYVHWIERIAWIGQFLNVGVPVFILISGFLYGHKYISDFKTWFIQRYLKIMIPIGVYCLVTAFVLGIIGKLGMPKTIGTLITILGCQGVISGGDW